MGRRHNPREGTDKQTASTPRRWLLLAIAATDQTFTLQNVRGQMAWIGQCIHCNTRIGLSPTGSPDVGTTLEHIVPRHHGGSDALDNVALACGKCNQAKGARHDHQRRDDPQLQRVIATLQQRRQVRWRDPATVEGPAGDWAQRLWRRVIQVHEEHGEIEPTLGQR
jgi:5-methylcytosine-specific restriction endonuclease McrA